MYFVCIERSLYWLVWVLATVYALYQFALVSQSKSQLYRLSSHDLSPGFLNDNKYDSSDFEWQSFKKLYINYWYIVLIHFALSNIFTVARMPTLKLTSWILITLYATYTVFSARALIVVMINVIMLILLAILGKNILSYALCFGVVLASQSTEIANRIFNTQDPRHTNEFDFEEKRFLFTYCICFLNARGLSSALDNLTKRQKERLRSDKIQFYEKLITIAAYLLYLPGFFAGPIYLYDDFEHATRLVRSEPKKESFLGAKYFSSMASLFILIIEILYYEWMLHFLYSSAISNEPSFITSYSSWQISGFIFSLCLLYYLKYSCIYGAFKVLTKFDGVSNISPDLPQCVAAMHLNSQLWRKFDVGIYKWLKKYIYDPIVKDEQSIFKRFLATLVCFFCIAMWHLPLTQALIMWISLNVIAAFVEIWGRIVASTQFWIKIKTQISRPNYLRILAVLGLPLFVLAISSNLYFLSCSEQVTAEFVKRVFTNLDNYAVYLAVVLFCGVNVSLDYNRVVKSDVDLAQCHGWSSCSKSKKNQSVKQAKRD